MSLTDRAYRQTDLPRVIHLLETRLAAGLPWNLSASDLRHVLTRPSTGAQRYGHVWESPSGHLLGFGLVWLPWGILPLLLHPDHDPDRVSPPTLCGGILHWADERAAEIARVRGAPFTLGVRVRDDQTKLISLLERVSYRNSLWCLPSPSPRSSPSGSPPPRPSAPPPRSTSSTFAPSSASPPPTPTPPA